MSSWGNNDNAANAPYWAVNSTIVHTPDVSTKYAKASAANVALLYGNTTPDVYITGETIGLFMVDSGEAVSGGSTVTDVSIIQGGSGYVEAPGVSFTGGGGSSAAATAYISGGKVTNIQVTNTGSSYETVPAVVIQVPVLSTPTSTVTAAANTITYNNHGQLTGDAVTYKNGGGSSIGGLSTDTVYYVIKTNNNTIKLAASAGDAANTIEIDLTTTGNDNQYFIINAGVGATAIADKGLGEGDTVNSSSKSATHTGWNMKVTGTGGRAGRVQWETLVATSDVIGDGSDDITLPDA
jgi:hypothetical protein